MKARRPAHRLLRLSLLAATPLFAACDIDSINDPFRRDIDGAYDLVRVDGDRPPVHIDTQTSSTGTRCDLDLLSASLVLETHRSRANDQDGEYELAWVFRETCRTSTGRQSVSYPQETETGIFERFGGDEIEFFSDGLGEDFIGDVNGDELRIFIGTSTMTFHEAH